MDGLALTQHGLPPAQGEQEHRSLALANSVVTLPGGLRADLLGDPDHVGVWLAERGFAPAGLDVEENCAAQIRSLREQIRSLFGSLTAGTTALPAAIAAVNDAMTRASALPLLRWSETSGPYRAAPPPIGAILEHAMAALAADAADLITSPDADRLTACGSAPCNRYLLRHGRRQWCSTRCGDRARAARSYSRRAKAS
ncbi:CGNR zinc finger domain-containing protein [Streptomyces liangshanensis]|uniref:CGNR zinc finger domain-containing protein n=1 Tax=Streptomyces liangshanensis TaxID=2717324 RepID=UPI0036DA1E3D